MPAKAEGETTLGCNDSFTLEKKLRDKEPRLPRRVAARIRKLKQEGKFEEAMSLRRRIIGQKIARNEKRAAATEELNKTIHEMICTDDLVKEAAANIKITWLFNALEEIQTPEERNMEILEILGSVPSEFQPKVEALMPGIRDEVVRFMPGPAPRPLAI